MNLLDNYFFGESVMKPKTMESNSMTSKMLLVANLYYRDKLSQQEIAKKLSISRPWVSKLLTRAETEGIVKIEIISPYIYEGGLEKDLIDKYGLKHIEIVHNNKDADAIAIAASKYLLSILQTNDTIGIGWGTSVSRMISHIAPSNTYPQVHIFPLAGSFGDERDYVPNVSALRLSESLGASAHMLHMPARCSSYDEHKILSENQETVNILEQAEHSDILLLGIGVVEDSFSSRYGLFSEDATIDMYKHNAIGDVALQYFDNLGTPIYTEATKMLIKADIFKASANARISIGIANGLYKVNMIHIALEKKLVNVFFTDEETALALLNV